MFIEKGLIMDTTKLLFAALLLAGIFLGGCAEPTQKQATEPICLQGAQLAQAMATGEDVLKRMHFVIEKSDSTALIVRTRPLSGAQFFEFWRRDNVGGYNAAQSNLHSIQRIVELSFSQSADGLCIACEVNVQRLSLPEKEINNASSAHSMFSESDNDLQRLRLESDRQEQMAWIDLGRDASLEEKILKEIKKRQ